MSVAISNIAKYSKHLSALLAQYKDDPSDATKTRIYKACGSLVKHAVRLSLSPAIISDLCTQSTLFKIANLAEAPNDAQILFDAADNLSLALDVK
jgi:hypothetical protein